jgi:hypothetical protein
MTASRVNGGADPWEERSPKYAELTPKKLLYYLEAGLESGALTDWEDDFCRTIIRMTRGRRSLSDRQIEILDRDVVGNRGILWKCWDENPDNWA